MWQDVDISSFISNQDIDITDLAQHKKVLEVCNHPKFMTDPTFLGYNGQTGYCGIHHPTALTVDLKSAHNIGLIQFLLNDPDEDFCHGDNERKYYFRVLVADDYTQQSSNNNAPNKNMIEWKVLYDSQHCGYRNWQFIHIESGIKARFIRLHCIYNDKNQGFHIVRLRAYTKEVANAVDYNMLRTKLHEKNQDGQIIDRHNLSQIISVNCDNVVTEIGDGFPLSKRIYDIANLTRQIADSSSRNFLQYFIEDKYLSGINSTVTDVLEAKRNGSKVNINAEDMDRILTSIADDISIMEKNSHGMKRVIVDPINLLLDSSNRTDLIWTIISIVLMVIPWLLLYFNLHTNIF